MVIYASSGFLRGGSELDAMRAATMKMYAATGDGRGDAGILRDFIGTGYPHVLVSFVYDRDGDFFDAKLRYWPDACMGDSGAFTVWTTGGTVDLEEYAAWCHAYVAAKPEFTFLNLDVIPGTFLGGGATTADRVRAMDASVDNADQLRAAGVPVIEVYHLYEPIAYLDRLIERRPPGVPIGLGGLAGKASRDAKLSFCDAAFARARDLAGGWDGVVPFHGLGIAPTTKLGARYPWGSVDSSSWVKPSRYGFKVGRSGKLLEIDTVAPRIPDARRIYLTRVLEGWDRRAVQMTRMWESRGVRFAP